MRTVTYKSVMDRVAGYMGEAYGLAAEEETLARMKFNTFLRLAWEHFWWPDLMLLEPRTFRAWYDSNGIYPATSEVFFPGDGQYYQALQTANGQAPASATGTGDWTVNAAYWAVCAPAYSADDWTAKAYALGDQTRNPADNQIYQCFSAHTGVGSMDLTKFGALTPFVRSLNYDDVGADLAAASSASGTTGDRMKIVDSTTGQVRWLRVRDGQLVVADG